MSLSRIQSFYEYKCLLYNLFKKSLIEIQFIIGKLLMNYMIAIFVC